MSSDFRWTPGTATGLGPFPGTDPVEAAKAIVDELDVLPHLPMLPARGPGSHPVGRTAALLVDLHVDLQRSGWRLVPHPGADERRARAALESDLDALEEAAQNHHGDLKLQLVGPVSLAASIELANGEKTVVDEGAVIDLTMSLAEGVARHLAEIRRRLPSVGRVVVALDEPLLPAAISGELPTISGWGRLRALEEPLVEDLLGRVLTAAGGDGAGVVCSVERPPIQLLRRAGARFLGLAAGLLELVPDDDLGDALEAGVALLVGAVPADGVERRPPDLTEPIQRLWDRFGFRVERLPEAVAVTPLDGLELLPPDQAAQVLRWTSATARHLQELAEDGS